MTDPAASRSSGSNGCSLRYPNVYVPTYLLDRWMDVTTVQCGKDTRDDLRTYRDANDLQNYDEAIRDLLDNA